MCEIRPAIERATGEMRTVKVFRKIDMNEKIITTMRREIEILSGLDHCNITKVHAVYEDELRFYLVIDTIKGGSLFEKLIKQG